MTMKTCGAAFALAITCLPLNALATGGVDCSVQDGNVDFSFEAIFGHGVVTPLMQVRASLDIKGPKLHGAVKAIAMDGSQLKQQWFRGSDLKLLFYVETTEKDAPFGAATLTIEATQPSDE